MPGLSPPVQRRDVIPNADRIRDPVTGKNLCPDRAIGRGHQRRHLHGPQQETRKGKRSTLIKQQAELQSFDEKLRHYADQRLSLDLDDGVKVNYGKFGDLLAEVKAVTGKG